MGFWQYPENIIIAVSSIGIFLMLKNKSILDTITYKETQSWEVDSDSITINYIKSPISAPTAVFGKENRSANTTAPSENMEVLRLQTKCAEDISGLMKEYSHKLGADRKKDRDFFAAEAELLALQKDLDKARTALLRKKAINEDVGLDSGKPSLASIFSQKPANDRKLAVGDLVKDADWNNLMVLSNFA
jgi:hypothetical protein